MNNHSNTQGSRIHVEQLLGKFKLNTGLLKYLKKNPQKDPKNKHTFATEAFLGITGSPTNYLAFACELNHAWDINKQSLWCRAVCFISTKIGRRVLGRVMNTSVQTRATSPGILNQMASSHWKCPWLKSTIRRTLDKRTATWVHSNWIRRLVVLYPDVTGRRWTQLNMKSK